MITRICQTNTVYTSTSSRMHFNTLLPPMPMSTEFSLLLQNFPDKILYAYFKSSKHAACLTHLTILEWIGINLSHTRGPVN